MRNRKLRRAIFQIIIFAAVLIALVLVVNIEGIEGEQPEVTEQIAEVVTEPIETATVTATPTITPEITPMPEPTPTYTAQELEWTACAIYVEAGGDACSDDTRLKVGCVMWNRVESELFPNTLYEVLTQEGQYNRFSWDGIVWPERAQYASEAHAVARAYEIAERVLSGERVLEPDYLFQSEYIQTADYIYQDGLYFCRVEE